MGRRAATLAAVAMIGGGACSCGGSAGARTADGGIDAGAGTDASSVCVPPPGGAVGEWTQVPGALNAGSAIWGSSDCDVWIASGLAADAGELAHWDGVSLSKVAQPWPARTWLFGSTARDVWAVGGSGVERWDGQSWSTLMIDTGGYPLTGGWSASPSRSWVVANLTPPPDNPWPACAGGGILMWNGQTWTMQSTSGSCGLAAWGASETDVWSVGWASGNDFATCDHWDGQKWHVARSGDPGTALFHSSGRPFVAVHGSSSTNVWAVGPDNGVARWDGHDWLMVGPPYNGGRLYGVWVAGPDDAWAVGGSGVSRWDGNTWGLHTTSSAPLRAVWGASPTSVWAVGDGAILHYAGTPN